MMRLCLWRGPLVPLGSCLFRQIHLLLAPGLNVVATSVHSLGDLSDCPTPRPEHLIVGNGRLSSLAEKTASYGGVAMHFGCSFGRSPAGAAEALSLGQQARACLAANNDCRLSVLKLCLWGSGRPSDAATRTGQLHQRGQEDICRAHHRR